MKKEYIIPIFVPHLGCPNQCTFCNQKKISGQLKKVTAKDVEETIEYYLKNFKDKNKYVEVAFFGGSFTAIDEKEQEELLNAAYKYIKNKKVNSKRNSLSSEIGNLMKQGKKAEALRELMKDEIEKELENKLEQGEKLQLIRQVIKKLQKGNSVEETSDMLEEEPENIRKIYEIAATMAPDYDVEKIYQKL